VLETAVMALMAPEDDASSGSTERIEKLEHKLKELEVSGVKTAVEKKASAAEKQPAPPKKAQPPKETNEQAVQAAPEKKQEQKSKNTDESSQYWQELLESLRQEEYYVFTHAKLALETKINGSVLEIVFDSGDEFSADLLKKQAASKAILERIKQHNDAVVGISVEIKAKPKDDGDANVLEMFGADIERI
jgi:N-acetyl-beta-hexosaminidase